MIFADFIFVGVSKILMLVQLGIVFLAVIMALIGPKVRSSRGRQ
jgi:hypothetical protein